MSWKDYFINSETKNTEVNSSEQKTNVQNEVATKFPDTKTQTNNNFSFSQVSQHAEKQSSLTISNELASKFFDAYENAFEKLNQDGYDFFEFFQTVMHGDINNNQTYVMAFGMGKAMDKNLTKEKLLSQSDYYINELMSLYNKNVAEGNQKKQDLINKKTSENQNLTSELSSLKQQLEGIQIQIQDREKKLSLIDSKYEPQITERDSKLMANDYAKNKIISTIETVKQGINNNLK
jgi:hypothetical protein